MENFKLPKTPHPVAFLRVNGVKLKDEGQYTENTKFGGREVRKFKIVNAGTSGLPTDEYIIISHLWGYTPYGGIKPKKLGVEDIRWSSFIRLLNVENLKAIYEKYKSNRLFNERLFEEIIEKKQSEIDLLE